MKKLLLATLACIAASSAVADVIFYEGFNYANGPIIQVGTNADSTTNWFRHSGTAAPSDALVKDHRLEVSATGGTLSRQDDVHRDFISFTNTQTIIFSSFTVNCTNLPTVTNYFAHCYYSNGAFPTFNARVFAGKGALPQTWRLGIAGGAGNPSKILPFDLAPNTDYQVVVEWDPVSLFAATLWVNPLSASDPNVITADAVSSPAAVTGYGFRQASSFGSAFFAITNVACATTFDEAVTNVWSTNAVAPIIATSPASRTNFVADEVDLIGLAAGQGLGNMTYQWLKNGSGVANANGNSNILTIASAVVSDTGNYQMVATTPYGLSATSSVCSLWITNPPVPPTITQQPPTNTTAFYHQSVTLQIAATGPPTLTYQWFLNNNMIFDGQNFSGTGTDTLTISDIFTNNGTTGTFRCDVTNPYGTTHSSNAVVIASGPPLVNIAYLRTLVDSSYVATNSNQRWQATGTVSTFTNLTTGDTSSYYLQDGTAGINIFVTHGSNWRPPQGASVSFSGFLSSFNSTLELEADTNDLTTFFFINTNADGSFITNSLPAPTVIPFNITNDLAYCETNLEGRIVMLTNVFFGANAGRTISATANTPITVTNAAGENFTVFFSSQDLDTGGKTLPAFAWAVIGVFNQNLGNAVTPRNQGYEVAVTRFADIVTDPPPAPVISAVKSGGDTVLSWPNVPWDNVNSGYGSNYSYSVLASPSVLGPYAPVAVGLTFTNTSFTNTAPTTAQYRDVNPGVGARFYRVTSP